MRRSPRNILFATWDGPQVAYLETLFLPIFERLAHRGARFHVVQFTWGDDARTDLARRACAAVGVPYRPVRVWRRPRAAGALATALAGARDIRRAVRDFGIDVLMPRGHLPGLAMLAARVRGIPLVLDADGLPLDEAVEFAGRSPNALSHRVLRDVEAQLVLRADVVLTRTARASDILLARGGAGTRAGKFHVVGNGRDPAAFHPGDAATRAGQRQALGIDATAPLLAYAGSLGAQYHPEAMLELLAAVRRRRPDARLLVLSAQAEVLEPELARRPALREAVITRQVAPDAVAGHLACADLGLAFRERSFSMQAVAPVKLGEYLLCGVPVLATRGIGDTTAIGEGAGRLLEGVSPHELDAAAHWLDTVVLADRAGFRDRCVATGVAAFSLDACVDAYATALEAAGHAG